MQPSPYLQYPNWSMFLHISVLCFSLIFGVGEWCRPPLLLAARLGGRCCSSPWRKLLLKTATEFGDTQACGSLRPEARPMLSTPPPSPPPRVGVEKEEEWDGMLAVLNDHVVDELMVVSTARPKDDGVNACAGGWRRWLSS